LYKDLLEFGRLHSLSLGTSRTDQKPPTEVQSGTLLRTGYDPKMGCPGHGD
jgi:hypothetical protein